MNAYISLGRVSESLLMLQAVQQFACNKASDIHQLKITYGINRDAAFEFVKQCGWITVSNDEIRITDSGDEVLKIFKGGEITKPLWRGILRNYILSSRPTWASLIPRGRKETYLFMSTEEKRCFNEAGLMDSPSDVIVQWWDALSAIMRHEKEDDKSDIGRAGEKLTMEFEEARTHSKPIWESIESNLVGYDIISRQAEDNDQRILIEVKSSSQPYSYADFIISRNEWDVAMTPMNAGRYYFYLWNLSSSPTLAILTPTDIFDHIPVDAGGGRWKEVKLPFSLFESKFVIAGTQ